MPKIPDHKNTDFTDYWLLFFHTNKLNEFPKAWQTLVDNAQLYEKEAVKEEETDYKEVSFFDAISEKYINKNIAIKALVAGEALSPYRYPIKVRLTCNFTKGDSCKKCGLFIAGGKMEIDIKQNPLELINCNEYHRTLLIKQQSGIINCTSFKIESLKEQNLQEIYLHPIMEEEKIEQRFTGAHAYCLSPNISIIPNKNYIFYGQSVNDPRDQSIVLFFDKYKEEQSSLETFQLNEKEREELKIFQIEDKQDVRSKLKEIYNDFSMNLGSIIRHRTDILFAIDLIYHTVLSFRFAGSIQRKGWGECLIVGDTGVGKSELAQMIQKHYKVGFFQSASGATEAGLIGGMTQMKSTNVMEWTLLPLNHGKLVFLDETSDIDREVIAKLTSIRSEGVATRTLVGGPRRTRAQVRIIWLSNPRKRTMALYDSGCDVITELVGKNEDISRFDFILTASQEEVTAKQINIQYSKKPKHKYKSDLCNKLILWTWSRKRNNVIFDEEVEQKILAYSIEMAEKYSSAFPLVLGSTIRLKLAKLSVALACRLFSTEDGINVIVKKIHVDYIKEWLEKIYRKPSFGYEDYSLFRKESEKETISATDIIREAIQKYCGNKIQSFMRNMLNTKRITALEIQDFAECGKASADTLRTVLVSNKFLDRKQGFYIKSVLFKKFLNNELKKEKELVK